MKNTILDLLVKEIEFAIKSKSLTLAYQAYGAVSMARRFGDISEKDFLTLSDKIEANGINNTSAWFK